MSVIDEQLSVGLRWRADGRRVVCALLIDAEGSSPFEPGALMLVDAEGAIEGSITGGCVEADVVGNSLEILTGDGPPRLLRYGVSDELAHTVGLMCGGSVEVLAHELRGDAREVCGEGVRRAAAHGVGAGIATLVDGDEAGAKLAVVGERVVRRVRRPGAARPHGRTRPACAQRAPHERAAPLRRRGRGARRLAYAVHLHAFGVPPTLVLVGAIDYSAAVAALAGQVGYRVVIVDAREAFARSDRFSRAATVHVGWPADAIEQRALGTRDAVIVFSHDPKFDEPAILAALRGGVGFIGALGSRRTAADRNRRLAEAGADAGALARVHSPCGLDIGAATPEEVAISIMAEVIAARSGRAGESLASAAGSIRPR